MLSTHLHFSDSELIQAYLQGNCKCFEALIMRYKDKVYTTIFLLVKDPFLSEDIFQETFIKIINTIRKGQYAEQGKFLQWALRVAHNLCMDHFRRVRRNLPITTEDGREISSLLQPDNNHTETDIERKQTHLSVQKLIELLPHEQREVVVLRIYGDLSFKEIANLTQVSINTALGRMRYGLINLRKMIADQQLVLR
ncbi:MAG: sigma-70 family RNA polymerase sigma factor [Bacteroidetes bacterium]|nr:sigma-70 family RNA polymerase sigma factor [Bacteroidota bacterium]MBS1739253.1 sigma-70 family RNA polymerase sigma factor [Bacteroidota bacterium]MBS1775552.1 sigma-70 family RNA polymerase sigma factor [Bacteroidota bacterium]